MCVSTVEILLVAFERGGGGSRRHLVVFSDDEAKGEGRESVEMAMATGPALSNTPINSHALVLQPTRSFFFSFPLTPSQK